MSMFKNVKVYLGLGPDEEYEDRYLDDGYVDEPVAVDDEPVDGGVGAPRRMATSAPARAAASPRAASPRAAAAPAPARTNDQPSAVGAVRPLRPVPTGDDVGGDDADSGDDEIVVRRLDTNSEGPTVRPRAIQHTKPKSVSPQSFGDAKILADEFKKAVPVVMNIRALDRDLSRRLIDFASGVCYALGGSMEKLASGVFLLTPRGVEVSGDDRRRLEERGYD